MYYTDMTYARINAGLLHQCDKCGSLPKVGIYLDDRLLCPDCVREYLENMNESDLWELFDYDRQLEIDDIYSHILTLDLEDICHYLGGELCEE